MPRSTLLLTIFPGFPKGPASSTYTVKFILLNLNVAKERTLARAIILFKQYIYIYHVGRLHRIKRVYHEAYIVCGYIGRRKIVHKTGKLAWVGNRVSRYASKCTRMLWVQRSALRTTFVTYYFTHKCMVAYKMYYTYVYSSQVIYAQRSPKLQTIKHFFPCKSPSIDNKSSTYYSYNNKL